MKKYWKLLLGLLLILAAVLVYTNGYLPARAEYESQQERLSSSISALQASISENSRYTRVQEQLPAAVTELSEKRAELYSLFPAEMKEEDQIMYVLYLEETFGTDISFAFGTPEDLLCLSDGSKLRSLALTVNYKCSYEEFQEMITYLASDEKLTSVYDASMNYNAEKDVASGTVTIIRYLLDSELVEYHKPDITAPATGKENIFNGPNN